MLEKIAIIEKAILELKESISTNQSEQPASNPIQWDKYLKKNTKEFILSLIDRYGYNVPIKRNAKFIKDEIWKYRISDFANILNTLQDRNFCKILSNLGDSNRIEYFSFIQP
jgi:hypothetical protein